MTHRLLGAIHICLLMILCPAVHAEDRQEQKCPIKIESFIACEDKDKKCTIVGYDKNGEELSSNVPVQKTPVCAHSAGGGLLELEEINFNGKPVLVYRSDVVVKMVLPKAAICDSSTTFQSGSRGSSCK